MQPLRDQKPLQDELNQREESHYTFGGFADPLMVYTPSLSLPLEARGRGLRRKASDRHFGISEQLSSLNGHSNNPRRARGSPQAARRCVPAVLRAAPPRLFLSRVLGLLAWAFALTVAAASDEDIPPLVAIPAGPFIMGSDAAEREAAYALDEGAYGHSITRQRRWYADETKRGRRTLPAYSITATPITNRQYAAFVDDDGHRAPDVDRQTWAGYGLIHPYERTRRHAWPDGRPPASRQEHPVVLVSHADALAYAHWLSARTGQRWRLPTEAEWEKAARGGDGRRFPWGDAFFADRLNSHDQGPFDTVPVGTFPTGASPFGILDGAGQVYEWTNTREGSARAIVKGGSWDDKGCGVCRPAARHSRPLALKHILIGFRLVVE